MSPHLDDVTDGERKRERRVLGNHGDESACGSRGEFVDIVSANRDRSGIGLERAADRAEERRLPSPVRSDEADELPGLDREGDGIEYLEIAEGERAVLDGDRGRVEISMDYVPLARSIDSSHTECTSRRVSRNRKNGAPSAAVTMPTGTSVGPAGHRAIVSVTTRNEPLRGHSSERGSGGRAQRAAA